MTRRLPLFRALESGSWDTLKTRWGADAKRRTVTFYEGDETAANAYMNKFGDKGIHAIPYTQARQNSTLFGEDLGKDMTLGFLFAISTTTQTRLFRSDGTKTAKKEVPSLPC